VGADTSSWLPTAGTAIWLAVLFAWLLVVTDSS
jgi:hypothetical protein